MLPLFYRQLSFRELSNLHKKAQLLNGLHGMCTHLPLTPEPIHLCTIIYLLSGKGQTLTIWHWLQFLTNHLPVTNCYKHLRLLDSKFLCRNHSTWVMYNTSLVETPVKLWSTWSLARPVIDFRLQPHQRQTPAILFPFSHCKLDFQR